MKTPGANSLERPRTFEPVNWLRRPDGTARRLMRTLRHRIVQHRLMPRNWLPSLRAARVLWRDYAHLRSVQTRTAIDRGGHPLPWYTYPAIEFLSQLDFRDKTVFEFGSGMSTLYWASVARQVVSVEDDTAWFEVVRSRAPGNARVTLETDLGEFPLALEKAGTPFDIIVVDGPARGRTRLKCARAAVKALRGGGLIILDNSDWLPESAALLRGHGLLQVDMTGFAPICDHVQTTSLFFDRTFDVPPLTGRQPMPGTGAMLQNWESPLLPVPGELVQVDAEAFRGGADVTPFHFDTDVGRRTFKAFTYLGSDDTRQLGIVDLDRQRTLLSRHAPATAAEIDRLRRLSWSDFRGFVNRHDMRRYTI
jgi:hypothetical protein